MYRAVIICLISIGCVAAVPQSNNYENRYIRQSNQAVPTSVSRVQNATQSPYAIPTYPVYPSYPTVNPVELLPKREKEALFTETVAEKEAVTVTTVKTPVNTTSVVESSTISRVLPYLKTFGQVLATILLSTSFLGLLCSYTPICSNYFLGTREARALAHSYKTTPNLNNVGTFVANAIEKYSAMQE